VVLSSTTGAFSNMEVCSNIEALNRVVSKVMLVFMLHIFAKNSLLDTIGFSLKQAGINFTIKLTF
jgi:hypothetical protein